MTSNTPEAPGVIEAIPVRHPGRVVAVVVVLLVTAMLIHELFVNPAFNWSFTWEAMSQTPVIQGFLVGTLLVTIGSMISAWRSG